MFLSSLTELMQWGLRGAALPRRRALVLRAGAVLGFLVLWSLASGLVVVLHFLAGPWLVLGKVLELALDGQLWVHVWATLERVIVGFGTRALAALALGLPAGYIPWVRKAIEPVVEMLRPIPPLAMLPLFIVWIGIGEGSKIVSLNRIPHKIAPESVFYTKLLEEVDPSLVKWKAKTEVK